MDSSPRARLLADLLPSLVPAIPADYLPKQRWFGSKTKQVTLIRLRDAAVLSDDDAAGLLILIDAVFADGTAETYHLPLVLSHGSPASAGQPIVTVETQAGTAQLHDGFADPAFCRALFRRIAASERLRAQRGAFDFVCVHGQGSAPPLARASLPLDRVRPLRAEQSNSSVIYDDTFILKGFRRLQEGVNPDLEVSRFLATRTGFRRTPRLAGYVTYRAADDFQSTIAQLQAFVPNAGDAWSHTLTHLHDCYRRLVQVPADTRRTPAEGVVRDLSKRYLGDAHRLGTLTGQLHAALGSDPADVDFAPQPVTPGDLAFWLSELSARIENSLALLARVSDACSAPTQDLIRAVLCRHDLFTATARHLTAYGQTRLVKIRIHGDYHLGQVLRVDDGFTILDFEGEPARPLPERRARQLAVKDVAGMLRSFDYATHAARRDFPTQQQVDAATLALWSGAWQRLVRDSFLDGYLGETPAQPPHLLPPSREDFDQLLAVFELEKALYELQYEANNRPDWLEIPLTYLAGVSDSPK